jgi:hypothetical protein
MYLSTVEVMKKRNEPSVQTTRQKNSRSAWRGMLKESKRKPASRARERRKNDGRWGRRNGGSGSKSELRSERRWVGRNGSARESRSGSGSRSRKRRLKQEGHRREGAWNAHAHVHGIYSRGGEGERGMRGEDGRSSWGGAGVDIARKREGVNQCRRGEGGGEGDPRGAIGRREL